MFVSRATDHNAVYWIVQGVLRANPLGLFWLLFVVYFSDNAVYLSGTVAGISVGAQPGDFSDFRFVRRLLRLVQFVLSAAYIKQTGALDLL